MAPYAAVSYIRYAIGYDSYLVEYARERRLSEDELLDVASDVLESARDFNSFEQWFSYIEDYGKALAAQERSSRRIQEWTALFCLLCTAPRGWNMRRSL